MKKCSSLVFLSVSLLFCLLVGVSAFFSQADVTVEQRDATPFPSFYSADEGLNKEFDAQLSDYLSERMPFRSVILDLKATIFQKVFASSTASDVIVGKNGWLYFEPTLPEYTGSSLLSDRGISNIVDTLSQIADYCEAKDISFVFTVAPNKNTLYDDNMPLRILRSDVNNFTRLQKALPAAGIPFVDFSQMNTWAQEPLYYATDSHWTVRGASMAYDALMDALEIEHQDYASFRWIPQEKQTDLMRMLYPSKARTETEMVPDVVYTYEYTSRFRSEEDINITTTNEAGHGHLLMFRDSFGNALLPFFAQHFSTARFSRAVPCDFTLADSGSVVIYEIVQRNLANIISYAPVMPAEKIAVPAFVTGDSGCVRLLSEPHDNLLHIYGEIDESLLAADSTLSILLTDASGSQSTYRCFPISESSMYDDGVVRDNGFSCYLDQSNLAAGSYQIAVCVQTNGKTIAYSADTALAVER